VAVVKYHGDFIGENEMGLIKILVAKSGGKRHIGR
jgi:hypothetical protein